MMYTEVLRAVVAQKHGWSVGDQFDAVVALGEDPGETNPAARRLIVATMREVIQSFDGSDLAEAAREVVRAFDDGESGQ